MAHDNNPPGQPNQPKTPQRPHAIHDPYAAPEALALGLPIPPDLMVADPGEDLGPSPWPLAHPFTNPTSWIVRPELFDMDTTVGDPYAHIPKGGVPVMTRSVPTQREPHIVHVTPRFALLADDMCFALVVFAVSERLRWHGDDAWDEGVPLQHLCERFLLVYGFEHQRVPTAFWGRVRLRLRLMRAVVHQMLSLARHPRRPMGQTL